MQSNQKLHKNEVNSMLEFLINNMFEGRGHIYFQQVIGIAMGTSNALSSPIFSFTPMRQNFILKLLKDKGVSEVKACHLTFMFKCILMMFCQLIIKIYFHGI